MESVSAFYILMMPLRIEQAVCLSKRLQIFSAVFFYFIFDEMFNFYILIHMEWCYWKMNIWIPSVEFIPDSNKYYFFFLWTKK